MAHRTAHGHQHAHLHHRHAAPLSTLFGSQTIPDPPSLINKRAASTCGTDGMSKCETPADDAATSKLIIGVAVAVPLVVALVVLFLLHRRIKRKMRHEDADEKHKSLDFGLDEVSGNSKRGRKGKKEPEMAFNARRGRGMSMDMDFATPYMLPPGLSGSRESLHSMSRSLRDKHDPYRPVTLVSSPAGSLRSQSRLRQDNGSVYTGQSEHSRENQKAGLLNHAARMANDSAWNSPEGSRKNSNVDGNRPLQRPPRNASLAPAQQDHRWYNSEATTGPDSSPSLSGMGAESPKDMLYGDKSLPAFPMPAAHSLPPLPRKQSPLPSPPPHADNGLGIVVAAQPLGNGSRSQSPHPLPSPPPAQAIPRKQAPEPSAPAHDQDSQHLQPEFDNRRVSTMGMRPLPLEDSSDNPEQRANRIRSFYKEYFDDTKPNPAGYYPDPYADEEEYYADFLSDGAIYDPDTGTFYQSHQPPPPPPQSRAPNQSFSHQNFDSRQAMTPNLRGPPSLYSHGHRSVNSTQSAARYRQQPQRRLPPPKTLQGLPTPHLLKDDLGSLIDFAPPVSFRERQNGRDADSPRGLMRPYSPAFRAHTPIHSSFDDLSVMPSPHALRKSGTFSALDFAPPPRFRERAESMGSDAGSIRSNRSGVSSRTQYAIRNGAYRLSKLPKNQVGSMVDLQQSLRPSMDIGRR